MVMPMLGPPFPLLRFYLLAPFLLDCSPASQTAGPTSLTWRSGESGARPPHHLRCTLCIHIGKKSAQAAGIGGKGAQAVGSRGDICRREGVRRGKLREVGEREASGGWCALGTAQASGSVWSGVRAAGTGG